MGSDRRKINLDGNVAFHRGLRLLGEGDSRWHPRGVPDPAAAEGSDTAKWLAFRSAFTILENRIKIFASLPIARLDRVKLQARLDAIGNTAPPEEPQ